MAAIEFYATVRSSVQVRGRVPVDWTLRCREQRRSAHDVLSVSRQQVSGSSPGSELIAAIGRSNKRLLRDDDGLPGLRRIAF